MRSTLKFSVSFLLIGILFCLSCKKETSCEGCATKSNKPPIAVAGRDQVITLPIDSVSLDGRSSSDPDGSISTYLWTKISGPVSSNIIKPSDSITKVKSLVAGSYLFELKVTDNEGLSAKDTVQVIVDATIVTNHPPIANAGPDQTIILPTNAINLDGSGSTDPENNITSFVWTKISGPSTFNIVNPNAIQTPVINLIQGAYQFELKVTDAGGLFSKDTLNLCVFQSLNGQEITYNSYWGCNDLCQDGDVYWASESNQCNPYIDSNMLLQVAIRLDTSSVWIDVHKINSPLPSINEFYWVIDRGFLWVFAFHGSLIGKPVTIKVNFL